MKRFKTFKQFFRESMEKYLQHRAPQYQIARDIQSRIFEDDEEGQYIKGDVNIPHMLLTKMPIDLRRVRIKGNFKCSGNAFNTLHGVPLCVEGDFHCDHNNLPNLKHSPIYVGGDYYCHVNPLDSLEGLPEILKGDFFCDDKHLPEHFEGWMRRQGYPEFRRKYIQNSKYGHSNSKTLDRL